MTKIKMTREEFRTWLAEKPDNAVVGYANDSTKDPICRFLRSTKKLGGSFENDGTNIIRITKSGHDYEVFTLPAWAQRFTDIIDDKYARGANERVTAAEARKAANR